MHIPAQGSPPMRPVGASPALPTNESLLVQLWGLTRELCTLAATLHPVQRSRFYGTLCAAGLFGALRTALSDASDASQQPDEAAAVARRSLEVLLLLLNHDPCLLRRATLADEADGPSGQRADTRATVGQLVGLLSHADEGILVQVSETLRIILDASTMEPAEQNRFLDYFYGSALSGQLLTNFESLARSSHAAAHTGEASFAHVTRLEVHVDVISSFLGRHGYRSQRLAADPKVWHALSYMLRQPRRSLRSTASRFLRQLLSTQPGCATLLVDHQIVESLLAQLLERNGRPLVNSLVNSTILSLLHLIATDSRLSSLRAHLLRWHRPQLQLIADARVQFVRDMLVGSAAASSLPPSFGGEENRPPASPLKESASCCSEGHQQGAPGSHPQLPLHPSPVGLPPPPGISGGVPLMPRRAAASLPTYDLP